VIVIKRLISSVLYLIANSVLIVYPVKASPTISFQISFKFTNLQSIALVNHNDIIFAECANLLCV